MATPTSSILLLLFFLTLHFLPTTEAGTRRVHIPDDLDDVIDDEEDEDWKNWGDFSKKRSEEFDPPNIDLSSMGMLEIQAELMKKHTGPSFGFVKLRLGVHRSQDMVSEIAMRWTRVLKTGTIDTKFMVVDLSTLMFTLEKGQDIAELKEFVLDQPESYEFKIGDQVFRRPGDPPLEEVIEMLHDKRAAASPSSEEGMEHLKDEL